MKYHTLPVLLILLISCREAELPTPEAEKIIGEWEWIESVGGPSGTNMFNPEIIEQTRQLEFDEYGKFTYFEDEDRKDKGDFSVTETADSTGSFLVIKMEGETDKEDILTFRGQDTMDLRPLVCDDCYTVSYVRKE